MNKSHILAAIFACFSVLSLPSANASIVINFQEIGGNVEASYSGSIDLNATLGFGGTSGAFNGYVATGGNVGFAGQTEFYNIALDLGNWTPFGTGGSFGSWDSSSGDALALFSNPVLGLASGYISGGFLSGLATNTGSSFDALGLLSGSYVSTFRNGLNFDSITVNVGQQISAVPVPAAAWLFGSALLGFFGFSRRKANA